MERTGKKQFRIVLTQGLNRQIRRMCEYFGYRVQKLVRVRIMNIELGDLEPGKYRDVTPQEYKRLLELIASSSNAPVRPGKKQPQNERMRANSNPGKEMFTESPSWYIHRREQKYRSRENTWKQKSNGLNNW